MRYDQSVRQCIRVSRDDKERPDPEQANRRWCEAGLGVNGFPAYERFGDESDGSRRYRGRAVGIAGN